ncbi:PEGA domain-containing protein [Carboxylicivirga sp. N1Y90]|uniref:PEGA domain-containing protein n=1 Tax=Carboxylicivirga fragile TaxID=3417571 RepID=UPI003D347CBD|nr:PEGA domain-containing protein [Marinilabiliaceae bacterium N1Y90]
MNLKPIYLFTLILIVSACKSSSEDVNKVPLVKITSPSEGYIYIDGIYEGHKTPKELVLSKGSHIIGVAMDASNTYLRKEITVGEEDVTIDLQISDKPEPKVWKGLWVGIREAT